MKGLTFPVASYLAAPSLSSKNTNLLKLLTSFIKEDISSTGKQTFK